ncbi:hypothetical protein HELRODRAFT_170975 [Helobdella robusta]|uniref:SH3 domain-containing protein n=1 Tax=Helobdella robusta TaxID=6412 RepID=T1F3N3_HELRO|nr:hypothetical protein HELRODRAFT_170975 [Helobdella robusta]ESO06939.1 hypothetical protein HELRODRAFT_170975 [Helobdella robusta]
MYRNAKSQTKLEISKTSKSYTTSKSKISDNIQSSLSKTSKEAKPWYSCMFQKVYREDLDGAGLKALTYGADRMDNQLKANSGSLSSPASPYITGKSNFKSSSYSSSSFISSSSSFSSSSSASSFSTCSKSLIQSYEKRHASSQSAVGINFNRSAKGNAPVESHPTNNYLCAGAKINSEIKFNKNNSTQKAIGGGKNDVDDVVVCGRGSGSVERVEIFVNKPDKMHLDAFDNSVDFKFGSLESEFKKLHVENVGVSLPGNGMHCTDKAYKCVVGQCNCQLDDFRECYDEKSYTSNIKPVEVGQTLDATGGLGKALNDYVAQSSSELSFKTSNYLTLLNQVNEDWFEATLGLKRGLVPKKYITILREPQPSRTQSYRQDIPIPKLIGSGTKLIKEIVNVKVC